MFYTTNNLWSMTPPMHVGMKQCIGLIYLMPGDQYICMIFGTVRHLYGILYREGIRTHVCCDLTDFHVRELLIFSGKTLNLCSWASITIPNRAPDTCFGSNPVN